MDTLLFYRISYHKVMLGYLGFSIALVGSTIAAVWDLKTTEVPDYVSIITAVSGLLVNLAMWQFTGNFMYFLASLVVGITFFALGWLFFMTGVWGGADAFVMGAVGFAMPVLPETFSPLSLATWPFALTLLMNIFIVGAVYTLLFAIFKGLRDKSVVEEYFRDIKNYWKTIILVFIAYCFVIIGISRYLWSEKFLMDSLTYIAVSGPFLLGMLLIYRFLKVVENVGMTNEIDVEDLSVGDVLAEDVQLEEGSVSSEKIVGLSEENVEEIRDSVDRVKVRSGVMFVPAFPVAILLSVTVGDLLFLFLV